MGSEPSPSPDAERRPFGVGVARAGAAAATRRDGARRRRGPGRVAAAFSQFGLTLGLSGLRRWQLRASRRTARSPTRTVRPPIDYWPWRAAAGRRRWQRADDGARRGGRCPAGRAGPAPPAAPPVERDAPPSGLPLTVRRRGTRPPDGEPPGSDRRPACAAEQQSTPRSRTPAGDVDPAAGTIAGFTEGGSYSGATTSQSAGSAAHGVPRSAGSSSAGSRDRPPSARSRRPPALTSPARDWRRPGARSTADSMAEPAGPRRAGRSRPPPIWARESSSPADLGGICCGYRHSSRPVRRQSPAERRATAPPPDTGAASPSPHQPIWARRSSLAVDDRRPTSDGDAPVRHADHRGDASPPSVAPPAARRCRTVRHPVTGREPTPPADRRDSAPAPGNLPPRSTGAGTARATTPPVLTADRRSSRVWAGSVPASGNPSPPRRRSQPTRHGAPTAPARGHHRPTVARRRPPADRRRTAARGLRRRSVASRSVRRHRHRRPVRAVAGRRAHGEPGRSRRRRIAAADHRRGAWRRPPLTAPNAGRPVMGANRLTSRSGRAPVAESRADHAPSSTGRRPTSPP